MHRNAEILEKRHERLTSIMVRAVEALRQAALGAQDGEQRRAVQIRRALVVERIEEVERRVWHALCVAKGWRKA